MDPASADSAGTDRTATMAAGAAATVPMVGRTLGHYQVLDEIGRGGMGIVYRALDVRLGRQVALKLVTSTAAARRERLLREAQALAQLAHPNVVPVYDVGVVGDAVYMAMELIEGQSLRHWLRAEPRPVPEVLRLFATAGDGLAAAHAAGLVHRDFKPSNVLLGTDGRVRVVDFGLARAVSSGELEASAISSSPDGSSASDPESAEGGPDLSVSGAGALSTRPSALLDSPLTRVGDIVGTPRYMSPEQRRGGVTDARTDQFSFCVALHEAVYDEHPFPTRAGRRRFEEGAPLRRPARRGVPGHIRRAVLRGLSRDPDARFPSMTALVAELRRDVRARRRRFALGAAGASVLGGAIAIAALAPGTESRCAGAGERADAAWRSGLRGAVERAILATGRTHAPQIASRLQLQVDDYVARWADLRTQTCRATRVHGEQSEVVMDRKMDCLDDRLEEVTAFLRALALSPTDTAMNRAVVELEQVSSLALCKDAEALARRGQVPVRGDEVARVEAVREGIHQVKALVATGNAAEVESVARRVRDAAQRIAHVATRAEASSAYSDAMRLRGQVAEARRALDETLRLAAESGDRALLALTWSRMVWLVGLEERRVPSALELMRAAEVALLMARDEPDYPLLEIEVGHTLASVQLVSGDLAGAEARFREVLAQYQALGPTLRESTSLSNLAIVLTYRGKVDEARALLARAGDIYQRLVGGAHPYVAGVALNTGLGYHWQGDLATAEREYRKAIELGTAMLGAEHPKPWLFHFYLGSALVDRGAYAAAAPELEIAFAGFAGTLGEDAELARHVRVARARLRLLTGDVAGARADIDAVQASLHRTRTVEQPTPGYLHPLIVDGLVTLAEGKADVADALLRRALDLTETLYGAGSLALVAPRIALAEVALARQQPRDAIAAATMALALLDAGDSVDRDPRRAEALYALARARRALHPSSREAQANAAAAVAIWDALLPGHPAAASARPLAGR